MTASAPTHEQLRALLLDPVEDEGFDLVAVELLGRPGRWILRITIDRPAGPSDPHGGVTIDDCSRVSRMLSAVLDAEDPVPGAYKLEVSSPGMERPIQRLEDFHRFSGFRVRIRRSSGDGRKRLKGRLLGVKDGRVGVATSDGESWLGPEEIERAHLLLDPEEHRQLSGGGPEPTH